MMTAVVVLVEGESAFTILGSRRLLEWTLKAVEEVRGVDRVYVAIHPDVFERARSVVARYDGVEAVQVPKSVVGNLIETANWVCGDTGPAHGADIVLLARPASPFTPVSKYEQALDLVKNGSDTAGTCIRMHLDKDHPARAQAVDLLSRSVFAFKRSAVPGTDQNWPHNFAPVLVSLIEGLNLDDPVQGMIARALVKTGCVC